MDVCRVRGLLVLLTVLMGAACHRSNGETVPDEMGSTEVPNGDPAESTDPTPCSPKPDGSAISVDCSTSCDDPSGLDLSRFPRPPVCKTTSGKTSCFPPGPNADEIQCGDYLTREAKYLVYPDYRGHTNCTFVLMIACCGGWLVFNDDPLDPGALIEYEELCGAGFDHETIYYFSMYGSGLGETYCDNPCVDRVATTTPGKFDYAMTAGGCKCVLPPGYCATSSDVVFWSDKMTLTECGAALPWNPTGGGAGNEMVGMPRYGRCNGWACPVATPSAQPDPACLSIHRAEQQCAPPYVPPT